MIPYHGARGHKALLQLPFHHGASSKVSLEDTFRTPIEVKSIDPRSTRQTIMHGTVTGKRKSARSAITNGSRLFAARVDLRTSRGARFKDLIEKYSEAIGSTLTEAQRVLVRDLAMMQVLSEDLQQRYMETGVMSTEDQTQYSRMSTNIKSSLKRLGLLSVKPQADDDDVEDPLEYARRGGSRKRAKLEHDDEEED